MAAKGTNIGGRDVGVWFWMGDHEQRRTRNDKMLAVRRQNMRKMKEATKEV